MMASFYQKNTFVKRKFFFIGFFWGHYIMRYAQKMPNGGTNYQKYWACIHLFALRLICQFFCLFFYCPEGLCRCRNGGLHIGIGMA